MRMDYDKINYLRSKTSCECDRKLKPASQVSPAPKHPELEKAETNSPGSPSNLSNIAKICRNQEKIYKLLCELADKFDFEHGYGENKPVCIEGGDGRD